MYSCRYSCTHPSRSHRLVVFRILCTCHVLYFRFMITFLYFSSCTLFLVLTFLYFHILFLYFIFYVSCTYFHIMMFLFIS
ncbi:hypothetical protein M6B38_254325 [Iris pallida]|uniref:Uncharacterized protein n=1 Tax=Iris pallida TaxID=29817 RepID=A0AAX6IJP1_IRIPA|nr:hypothetical protein M6B38_254325 [Iris pallida]